MEEVKSRHHMKKIYNHPLGNFAIALAVGAVLIEVAIRIVV